MNVSHTDPHIGRKKSIHYVCQFEALGNGVLQNRKQFRNPEALRILELISDLRYYISKCLKLARQVNQLFSVGLCEDLCVGERGRASKVYIDLCHPEYTKTPSNLGE